MSQSVASPPLAPVGFDVDVYVALDDFGSIGRSYRETAEEGADRESLIRDLMGGLVQRPGAHRVLQHGARNVSRRHVGDCARDTRSREP